MSESKEKLKKRLFVDMDGTLAEFKNVDTLEKLYEPGYFLGLNPQESVIESIQSICANEPDIEVFILSAVLTDSPYALNEKNAWLDTFLPEIDDSHRIFPPCGKDKKEYIPDGVRPTDYLLDDYTTNLTLWQPPAKGIKLLNGINHTNGTWQYDRLDYRKSGKELADNILSIMKEGEIIKDNTPSKAEQEQQISKLAVLQLREGDETTHYKSFMGLEDLKEAPTGNDYEIIYFEENNNGEKPDVERLFERFNSSSLRPSNYYGHSLNVSDVIVVENDGKIEIHYCDDYGFTQLNESFLNEKIKEDFKNGLDVRKEYNHLENVITNGSGLTESEYNRLCYLEKNYLPIFKMADKRAIILDNQDTLKAIREYEIKTRKENPITVQYTDDQIYIKAEIFRENTTQELERLVNERFSERVVNWQTDKSELPFPEMKSYKYYMTQSAINLGTYPIKDGNEMIENYRSKISVAAIGKEVWGEIIYHQPLTVDEMEKYSLVPEDYGLYIINAEYFKEWADKNSEDIKMTLETAEMIEEYLEGHGYALGYKDNSLQRIDLCNGEVLTEECFEHFTLEELIDTVSEYNYEFIKEKEEEIFNCHDIIEKKSLQNHLNGLLADERVLDCLVEKEIEKYNETVLESNNDKEYVMKQLEVNPEAYKYASERVREDLEVATMAISKDPELIKYSGSLRDNEELKQLVEKGKVPEKKNKETSQER